MRGFSRKKVALFTAMSGIAGLAIFGSCSARAAENGARNKPDGRAVFLRVADDDPAPAEKDAPEGDDIVRRLRERRAEEAGETPKIPAAGDFIRGLRERRAEAAEEAAEAEARPGTAAPERRRSLVGELARRAAAIVAPAKEEKVTFLGVGASPAPAVLTHQLNLPADFGLVVDEVVQESPADKAGLKPFDLLQKLDDQLLVDERQLTALVHSRKPGETVTLTVIREGKPLALKAKLGEHEELAEGYQPLRLQVGEPPGAEAPNPPANSFRFAPDRNRLNLAPTPGQPLRPGAEAPPRGAGGAVEPRSNGLRPPQANPAAPAEPGNAGEDEARRLEQELRSLRATADQLRAQIEARKKQEAEGQKGNGPQGQEQRKEGEKP